VLLDEQHRRREVRARLEQLRALEDLLITHREQGVVVQAVSHRRQPPDLLQQSLPEHLLDAKVDAPVEGFARADQSDEEGKERGWLLLAALKGGDGPAGDLLDLEGADDALDVVGMEPRRAGWIHLRQLFMDGRCTLGGDAEAPFLLDRRVRGLRGEEAVDQGADVKARAAGHHRLDAPREEAVDARARGAAVAAGAVLLVGVADADKMVADALQIRRGGLGRADVHVTVDLARVGRDDLAAEPGRQGQGYGALAGRRRADQDGDSICGQICGPVRPR